MYAATAFYGGPDVPPDNPGLLDIPDWQALPVAEAAHRVQRSAFPGAYARHEPLATQIVTALADGVDPATCLAPATVSGEWTIPVDEYRFSSPVGARNSRWVSGYHTGVDLAAVTGTPIRAASTGEVTRAGWGNRYGHLTVVDHGGGITTWYAHQSQINVEVGDQVTVGDVIGLIGSTGNSTGPHLHFEVCRDGTPTDPEPWLQQRGLDVSGGSSMTMPAALDTPDNETADSAANSAALDGYGYPVNARPESPHLAEAQKAIRALTAAREAERAAQERRDAAVFEAHQDGVGPTEIARALDMTVANVANIVRSQRQSRGTGQPKH